jgi:integrase
MEMSHMKIVGRGTVEKRKRGVYRIRFNLGKDPNNPGKYLYSKWRIVLGTVADVEREKAKYRAELEGVPYLDAIDMRLDEFADLFHAERVDLRKIGEETARTERYRIKRIKKHFGNPILCEVDANYVTAIYQKMVVEHGASKNYLFEVHRTLKQIFKAAVKKRIISFDPMLEVDPVPQPHSKRKGISAKKMGALIAVLNDEELTGNILAIFLALATGMRRGEILGLIWEYVSFEDACLFVEQTIGTKKHKHAPKTENSIRMIPLDSITLNLLREWKAWQEGFLASKEIVQGEETPVCINTRGEYIDPHSFNAWWRRFSAKHGFEGVVPHELRHTYASHLLGNGIDVKTVQELLGHSKPETTLRLYCHALEHNKRIAANTIGSLLFGDGKACA